MCSHLPNKGEQMVRYYGYYSNVSRGRRKNSDQDGLVPCILQPAQSSKGYRKNWARLIQKIYTKWTPLPARNASARCGMEGALRLFSLKTPSVSKSRTRSPLRSQRTITTLERPRPPQSFGPQHHVPTSPLTHTTGNSPILLAIGNEFLLSSISTISLIERPAKTEPVTRRGEDRI